MEFFKKNIYTIAAIVVIVFFFTGYYLGLYIQQNRYKLFLETFTSIREKSDKYTFINPPIGGISAPATDVGIFKDIQEDIYAYVQSEKNNGDLYDYSFYFRDINTGFWFGNNEDSVFFPASLFKLPIAIAAYKEGEDDPTFLKKKVIFTDRIAKISQANNASEKSSLVLGQAYTVEELVQIMLENSDNGAKDLLYDIIDKKYVKRVFDVISFVEPQNGQSYSISSRQYAFFLRMLYNSSFLNEDHSELLLKTLSQSTFKDGLVAGIPSSVVVSHKFGVFPFSEDGKNIVQLHDCGVVYHVKSPYIICFMTKGKDDQALFKVISHVSQMIYQYQDSK